MYLIVSELTDHLFIISTLTFLIVHELNIDAVRIWRKIVLNSCETKTRLFVKSATNLNKQRQ